MRIVAEIIGLLMIGAALYVGWAYIIKRYFSGEKNG